jgi:pimeloyl-ACP methyl ester carboxylesterase
VANGGGGRAVSEPVHRTIETNGISMHVAEQGDGPLVVLSHGFPELWYSWRHQLPALADAGYHAAAPDLRGYGCTDRPDQVEDYDIFHLTADLTGLLDAYGEDRAVFVGHDWGAIVSWQLALLAPERVRAVANLSVPFFPRPTIPMTEIFKAMAGRAFFYILYFQRPEAPERELSEDVRHSLLAMYWAWSGESPRRAFRRIEKDAGGYLDQFPDPPQLPSWLSEEDLGPFVRAFERTGFTGGLNYYRNFDRNWELTEHLEGAKVEQPAFFATGDRDATRRMSPAGVMEGFVPDLREELILPGCGHWTQQERPEEVNRALIAFLDGL